MNKDNEFMPKDFEFENLVKKAKTRSMIKMVLISLIISVVVLIGLYFVGDTVMKIKMEKETLLDSSWSGIRGANVEEQGTTYTYSPITATAKTKLVKKIAGVPIPWGENEKVFSIFGTSRLISTDGPSGSGNIGDERIPLYYQGERVTEFYHPEVTYKQIFDDRDLLNEMDDDKVVEMAFSFDNGYSIEEVTTMFKDHLAWYWVDTFNKEEIEEQNELNKDERFSRGYTTSGFEAYGFQYINYPNAEPAANFISILERIKTDGGNYQAEATEIYNNITNKGKEKLTDENLKIIGIVVTGKPSELQKYTDSPIIRGAILGATIDQY